MAFMTYCNNKGCGKNTEPMLDVDTGEVYCNDCDKVISNLSIFIRNQLKGFGQIRKAKKQQ